VYASQAAACIGENRHKKLCDAAEAFWERADSKSYRAALTRNGIFTDEEILTRVEHAHPEVSDMLRTAAKNVDSSTEVADKYASLATKFQEFADENKIDDEVRRVVDDALRKTSYTTYGNARESHVFKYIRDAMGIDCVEDPTFYKIQAGTIKNQYGTFPWFIGGKIDGISSDRKLLIEIKNRVNRLFKKPPSYEVVQVQTYLHLLEIEEGVLVECIRMNVGEGTTRQEVNTMTVKRDRRKWNDDIFPKLEGFVDFIVHLINDHALQDKFLKSKRRSALISAHVLSRGQHANAN
jgi:hypothetical protein